MIIFVFVVQFRLDRTKGDEEESDFHPLRGRALFKSTETNQWEYERVEIVGFTKETNKYRGYRSTKIG